MQMRCVHSMWCTEYEPYSKRLDREVVQGRKFKNRCDLCGRKWIGVLKYKGIYKICDREGREIKEVLKKEGEKVLRCTM